jgi:lysophospholipase L1-like esterase
MPIEKIEGQGFVVGSRSAWVCLGDSITEAADGYVSVMQNLVAAAYPERDIRLINAGIGGNRAPEMLDRLQRDVIDYRPNVVTISVGVNDIWHGFQNPDTGEECPQGDSPRCVPIDRYAEMVGEMVDLLREQTDARIALMAPTLIGEDVDEDTVANRKLDAYAAAMEKVAESRSTIFIPLRAEMVRAVRAGRAANPGYKLTTDGVHMNPVGNTLMALSVLYGLGFAS